MAVGIRVVWPEPGRSELEEFSITRPASGQVEIRTEWSSISPGTERGWLSGRRGFPWPGVGFPFYPGYGTVGVVEAVGPDVRTVQVGQQVFTSGEGYGCHASTVVVDEKWVYAVPDDVDHREATFFTLADTAIAGVRRTRLELGESCLVVGLGPVGLMAIMAAKANGAMPVVGVDSVSARRDLALELGARSVLAPEDVPHGEFDVAIEFADGSDAAVATAINAVGRYGRVLAGSRTVGPSSIDLTNGLLMKNADFIHMHVLVRPEHESRPGIWSFRDSWRTFVRMLQAGTLKPGVLIQRTLEPSEVPLFYSELLLSKESPMGVIVDWRSTR